MVLDVNTEYFETQYERHGYVSGYDFAKAFYAEAYKMAVADVGDEKYVLSATMHADERNKGLSAQLGVMFTIIIFMWFISLSCGKRFITTNPTKISNLREN